ncbi:MAG: B12-binding domain-containing radical SAM protein [Fluviicola sp. XM-24bin1]|nr:MAG: B12-binding domain-containing radical SAM protein [Fluviicola sp. XM-24bin1]
MKIVLTHAYFIYEDVKEQEIMRPYPTLGLLYISAFLKDQQKDVTLIDSTFSTISDWQQQILSENPEIIAFYTNLMTKVEVLQQLQFLKKELPKTTFVVGGPDVTYNQENYLNTGFDIAVIGEGEQTMLELVDALENKGDLTAVPGISFLKDGNLHENEARVKIKDLPSLPFPDRSAIPFEKYLSVWKEHHGKRTANISTQRGCPYTCKWCSTAVYGQSYRRNDPKRVVDEIFHLKEDFGVEALWFVDDVFTVSHKWLGNLHAEFAKQNLTIPFEIITRAERLNETVLSQLKDMGCFRIWIGAESGSQRIIDKMDRRVTLETVQEMMQLTRKFGMEAGTFIMVGYPGETHEDITATMDHIEKCNPDLLTITRAYPIKGTALYTEIENEITVKPDWNTSTDRDIRFKLPYSDAYYENAIRYLVNGWQAHKNKSLKNKVKSKAAYQMMRVAK